MSSSPTLRAFKTAWFNKAAKKAHITDAELSEAIHEVMLGQADDLGGGVFKKRLKDNRFRSLILTKHADFWVYEFLFAKADRDNIDAAELQAFRGLAKGYANLNRAQIIKLIEGKHFYELPL